MKKLLFFTQKDLAFWTMRVNNAQMLMSREALFPHCSSPDMHDLGQLEVQSEDQASLHNPQFIRLLFIEVWFTWPVPWCLDKNYHCRHLHNDILHTKPTAPDLYMEVVRAVECLCFLLHIPPPPFFKPPFCLFDFIYEGEAMGTAAPIIITVYPRNDGVLSRRLMVGIRIPTNYQQSPPTPTDSAIRIEERPGMTVYAL